MERSLVSLLNRNLDLRPEKTALVFDQFTDSFEGIARKATRIASSLRSRGLKPKQRVGLLLSNVPEFIYAYYGILMAGGQVVPMNVMWKTPEITYIGKDSQLEYMIVQAAFVENAVAAKGDIASLKDIFSVGEASEGTTPFEELMAGSEVPLCHMPESDDTAVIFYTSGTTGHPKGAMLTHENLQTNAIATAKAYHYNERDVIVFGMPLFHSSGQTNVMNAAYSCGASLVLLPRFSVEGVLEAFRNCPVSVFVGVPTMYHQMLHHPQIRQMEGKKLRALIVGAAPLPETLFHAIAERFRVPITEGYGLSEAGPVVAHNPMYGEKKVGSVGLPVEGVSVRVVDEEDREVSVDEVGELLVRGPNVMQGYLNQPEATSQALKDGWLHTGDMARIDQDGYIFIVDRKKDMILTGGFNIYPREIEEVIHLHPSVDEAAVIGIPDEEKGELAAAFVILKPGQTPSGQEIIEFCRSRMAVYKAPRQVFFVDELPRNPSGKVLKRFLREGQPQS